MIAFDTLTISIQIWNYLQSDIFKIVTVSLILPILTFLIENRFQIAEKFREEKREKRMEIIQKTTDLWNELWDISCNLIMYKKDDMQPKTISIEEILEKEIKLENRFEQLVNAWYFRFNLSEKNQIIFLSFVNVMLNLIQSVSYHIAESKDTQKEINEIIYLQKHMRIIQESIKNISHHNVLAMIMLSSNLKDIDEGNESIDKDKTQKQLKYTINYLTKQANYLMKNIHHNFKIFGDDQNEKTEDFRQAGMELLFWLKEDKKRKYSDYEKVDELREKFFKIPNETKFSQSLVPIYSKETIAKVAEEYAFWNQIGLINDISEWPIPKETTPEK